MPWCWLIRRDLTALVDDELAPRRAAAVRTHLEHCSACAARHRDIERGVAQQRQLLPLAVGLADVAADPLLQRISRRARAESEPSRRLWWQPVAVAATAVAALVVVAFLGLLDPVLIAMGFEDPPNLVAEQPELFRDYALFEYLDALENFDDILPGRRSSDDQQEG